MKVAHFVVVTPGRCGLYETTRELVTALRAHGVDSRMFDPTKEKNKLHPGGTEDRGAIFCDESFLYEADVWVSHSGLGKWEGKDQRPTVLVAHGRPRSSFMGENAGGTKVYSYYCNKNYDPNLKHVVTFWPEHTPYLRFIMPDKPITCVPACVDTDFWSPGPTDYDFAGNSGKINVVLTDSWRNDIDPFVPLHAAGVWARSQQGVKLHIYAKSPNQRGWAALIKRLQDDGTLGVYQGWASNLRVVYRAADMVLTGNEIDVRTVREAEACGCPVVRFPTADISKLHLKLNAALSTSRQLIRKRAEGAFNPKRSAEQFVRVLDNAIHKAERYS